MKRIALLIGSPSTLEEGNYLPGVASDIINMECFLLSSIGGSWQKNEIIKFKPNPSFDSVKKVLNASEEYDFSFVYFSGHGATDKSNNLPRIILNKTEHPYVKEIANNSKKQITIVDACRGYSEFSNFIGEGLSGIEFPNPNPEFSRKLYSEYISKLPNSRVLLFASKHSENAKDTSQGGLFSVSLLNATKDIVDSHQNVIVNISEVFKKTQEILKNKQNPDFYFTSENAKRLPFAVKPYYILKSKQFNEIKKVGNPNLIEDVVKGVLVSTAIISVGFLIKSLTGNKE